eukprot:1142612-Pelagomonas_calceolata.AAC.4
MSETLFPLMSSKGAKHYSMRSSHKLWKYVVHGDAAATASIPAAPIALIVVSVRIVTTIAAATVYTETAGGAGGIEAQLQQQQSQQE